MTIKSWITTAEAADYFRCRGPNGFLKVLTEHGGVWDPKARSPSGRTLRFGLAKRDPTTTEWLWLAPFVDALGSYLQWRYCVDDSRYDTPAYALGPFITGLNSISLSRPGWKTEDPVKTTGDHGYTIYRELRDEHAFMTRLSQRGLRPAIEHIRSQVDEMLAHVDLKHPCVVEGRDLIEAAYKILDGIGPRHPYVRYGLLALEAPEDPFPEPPAKLYANFKPFRSLPSNPKPRRTPDEMLEDALRPLLERSQVSPQERDRLCLVPEAKEADLRRLMKLIVSRQNDFGKALKKAGLGNFAAIARAVPDEINSVSDKAHVFAQKARNTILLELERYKTRDAREQERKTQEAERRAREALTSALRVLLKRSAITEEERERACLVPEAKTADLYRLATMRIGPEWPDQPALKRAGLTNLAAFARATKVEIRAIPAMTTETVHRIRTVIRNVLSELAEERASAEKAQDVTATRASVP